MVYKIAFLIFSIIPAAHAQVNIQCLADGLTLCESPATQSEKLKMQDAKTCYTAYLQFEKIPSPYSKSEGEVYMLKGCEHVHNLPALKCYPAIMEYMEPLSNIYGKKGILELCDKTCTPIEIKDKAKLDELMGKMEKIRSLKEINEKIAKYNNDPQKKLSEKNYNKLLQDQDALNKAVGTLQFRYRGALLTNIKLSQEDKVLQVNISPVLKSEEIAKRFFDQGPDTFKKLFAQKPTMTGRVISALTRNYLGSNEETLRVQNQKNEFLYNRAAGLITQGKESQIYLFHYNSDGTICADDYYRAKPLTLTINYGLAGLIGGYKKFGLEAQTAVTLDEEALKDKLLEEQLKTAAEHKQHSEGSNGAQKRAD